MEWPPSTSRRDEPGQIPHDAVEGREEYWKHDQTGRSLGNGRLVGVARFLDGAKVGVVPNKKLPHWVYK
jgi:hypothetical protein